MRILLFLLVVLVFPGCAATWNKNNPGRFDRGIRYYRSKPYLMISAEPNADASKDETCRLRIELKYLQDFGEQSSIHVFSGIGFNHTTIALDDGWNLTNINIVADTQFDKFVKSMANLIKVFPTQQKRSYAGEAAPREMGFCVEGYDVPLGLYEAVISRDDCGKKRIYGWRYVGFVPYGNCPIEADGMVSANCGEEDFFGLVFVENRFYFMKLKRLQQMSDTYAQHAATTPPPAYVQQAIDSGAVMIPSGSKP